MVEAQREDRVAGLEQPEVDGHVRLRARMRLDVRVLGAEELLRAVDRELLDLVDDLAAAVVAAAGVPLGVLVREHGADRLEHGRPREVLRRDQLDLPALAVGLSTDQRRDLGIVLREPPGPQTLEVVGGDCHGRIVTPVRPRGRGVYPMRLTDWVASRRRSTRARSAPGPPKIRSARPSRAATTSLPESPRTRSRPGRAAGSRARALRRGRRLRRDRRARRLLRARRSRRADRSPRAGRAVRAHDRAAEESTVLVPRSSAVPKDAVGPVVVPAAFRATTRKA